MNTIAEICQKMDADLGYTVSTENSFMALCEGEEMARDGFANTVKRKRYNTGQSDKFVHSSVENKLNIMFDEILCIRGSQEETNRGMLCQRKWCPLYHIMLKL